MALVLVLVLVEQGNSVAPLLTQTLPFIHVASVHLGQDIMRKRMFFSQA
jgi:hypothetical protein